MTRTDLILLPALLMSVFLTSANASAACREGKFILKPRADGSVLIDDECQPAAPSRRSTSSPRQETKTPPQPAIAETKPETKTPTKTDILGFTLGMSEEEITKRGAVKGTCNIGLLDFDCFKNKDNEVEIKLTDQLDPNVAHEVKHKFKSGRTPLDMVAYISEQYGIQPKKEDWNKKFTNATTTFVRCIPKTFLTDELCYDALTGGDIATWQMGDGAELELGMQWGAVYSKGQSPDKYELVLTSERLRQADVEARKQHDKEAVEKARGVNPNPKF